MPVLARSKLKKEGGTQPAAGALAAALFPRCANPACTTGWMHLWRNRQVPGFEGRWACSPACMEALVAAAVRREMDGAEAVPPFRAHRVPVGLMLVRQGTITQGQLHGALHEQLHAAQAGDEAKKLGEWLVESGVLSEPALTRALSLQWNCPVFSLDGFQAAEMTTALPRFLADAFGALPVRTPGGRLLYLAFAGRVDRSLSYAVERMTGLRVVAGIAPDSSFRPAHQRYSAAAAPAQFLEADTSWALVRAITERIEAARAVDSCLARVHDVFWLRIWRRPQSAPGLPAASAVEDLLATIGIHPRLQEGRTGYREI